jgi:hypothetical protein
MKNSYFIIDNNERGLYAVNTLIVARHVQVRLGLIW